VNGVSIDADDDDDRQLSAAKNRVYGLLVHLTVPVLPGGFFRALGGSFEPSFRVDRLGNPRTFASPGISLKPYPSGSLTHPAKTEMVRPSQVDKVDIGANHNMTTTLLHYHPKTGLEAKLSMEFYRAILLLERKAGLGQFSDQVARRPDVQEMIGKINDCVDPEAEQAGFDKMTSILRIHFEERRGLRWPGRIW
jgi:2-methylcitrate dehydratase PrpD